MSDTEELARRHREQVAIQDARRQNRSVSYIDDDGCEITVTPSGYIFYNAVDWY